MRTTRSSQQAGTRGTATVRILGSLAAVAGVGLATIALALLGVPVPGPPRFPGPGGPPAFLVVGTVYAVLAALFGVSAVGVFTRRRWAWPVAVVANALTLLMTIVHPIAAGHVTPQVIPYLALTVVALALLASPPGRTALRHSPKGSTGSP